MVDARIRFLDELVRLLEIRAEESERRLALLEEFDRALHEVDTGDAELQESYVPDKLAMIHDLIETSSVKWRA